MNITEIHEHKVCLDLLPEKARIMDIGCRGFLFSDYFVEKGHWVDSFDIDTLDLNGGKGFQRTYYRIPILGNQRMVGVNKTADPQATHIKEGGEMLSHTIESWMADCKLDMYDLIKIDVEGSELEIINSLTRAPAKQITWEAHLHTGIYGMDSIKEMENKLISLGYIPLSHEITEQHGAGKNYWSSLWILKEYGI